MQRKPGFPVANCSIKMPDNMPPMVSEPFHCEEDVEQQQRRQQLINFGHSQWGFNNWNWTVTKQELDFVDLSNGKYCAGVVAFVSVTVKSFDLHRENVGYATSIATTKGFAIYKSRKCAVTNALRETLLGFGGTVATELMDLLDAHKPDLPAPPLAAPAPPHAAPAPPHAAPVPPHAAPGPPHAAPVPPHAAPGPPHAAPGPPHATPVAPHVAPTPVSLPISVPPPPGSAPEPASENNQNLANKIEAKRSPLALAAKAGACAAPPVARAQPMPLAPPVARAQPMPLAPRPARAPLAPAPPAAPLRPNSNVSFVLQPVMPPLYPPRLAPPVAPVFPNYYECGPWHFAYEPHHGNVNLNFNLPPKNLVVNGRGSVECRSACRDEPAAFAPQQQAGCWIKPTIFYDGFWTEQKVKKWVAEQVEKQFPEDAPRKVASPAAAHAPHPDAARS